MKCNKREIIIVLSLIVSSILAVKWRYLALPFYWDENGFFYNIAHNKTLLQQVLDIVPNKDVLYAVHPPIAPFIVSIFTKLFGFSAFNVHFITTVIFAAGLIFIYLSAIKEHKSRSIASAVVVLTFLTPVYFIQSGLAFFETLMVTFLIAAIYAIQESRPRLLGVALFCLAYSKLSALAPCVAIFAYTIFFKLDRKLKLVAGFGLAAHLSNYVFNFIGTGKFVIHQDTKYFSLNVTNFFNKFLQVNSYLFLEEGRWFLSIILCLLLVYRIKTRVIPSRILLLLAAIVLSFSTGLSFGVIINAYYLTPVIICLFYSLIYLIPDELSTKFKQGLIAVVLVASSLLAVQFHRGPGVFPYTTSLRFLDGLRLFEVGIDELKKVSLESRSLVWLEWPMYGYLNAPFLGYVDEVFVNSGTELRLEHYWIMPKDLDETVKSLKIKNYEYILTTTLMSTAQRKIMERYAQLNKFETHFNYTNEVGSVTLYKRSLQD